MGRNKHGRDGMLSLFVTMFAMSVPSAGVILLLADWAGSGRGAGIWWRWGVTFGAALSVASGSYIGMRLYGYYREAIAVDSTTGEASLARSRAAGNLLALWFAVAVVIAWYGLRNVLDSYQANGALTPTDAPDVLVALSGASAVVTAISLAVARLMRAGGEEQRHGGGCGVGSERPCGRDHCPS
ncbi:hypothetical protein GCM10010309_29130 [Streptomyces violaceochromogenes]|nr:hypothetical protein GCM10010309_29130 [Streptomyces violaceochromogenes]